MTDFDPGLVDNYDAYRALHRKRPDPPGPLHLTLHDYLKLDAHDKRAFWKLATPAHQYLFAEALSRTDTATHTAQMVRSALQAHHTGGEHGWCEHCNLGEQPE